MSLLRLTCALLVSAGFLYGQYYPEPRGSLRLAWKFIKLDLDIQRARAAAEEKGVTGEEYYRGYPLSKDPATRRKQMLLHYAAEEHEEDLIRVLRNSSDAKHRAIAATSLGYTRPSHRQLEALVHATSDANSMVRDNAARALRALAVNKPDWRGKIPSGVFER